jgi:hypothetical protein
MPQMLDYLEKNPKGDVKEWGISHATLEEVFLNVTKRSNFVFSAVAGKEEESKNLIADDAFEDPLPVDESETLLQDVSVDHVRVCFILIICLITPLVFTYNGLCVNSLM